MLLETTITIDPGAIYVSDLAELEEAIRGYADIQSRNLDEGEWVVRFDAEDLWEAREYLDENLRDALSTWVEPVYVSYEKPEEV